MGEGSTKSRRKKSTSGQQASSSGSDGQRGTEKEDERKSNSFELKEDGGEKKGISEI